MYLKEFNLSHNSKDSATQQVKYPREQTDSHNSGELGML